MQVEGRQRFVGRVKKKDKTSGRLRVRASRKVVTGKTRKQDLEK